MVALKVMPKMIEFLGYDPRPIPSTIGEEIRFWREARGLRQDEMARRLGVDPSTLSRWECGMRVPRGKFVRMVMTKWAGEK